MIERGCVTPVQFEKWKGLTDGNPELIDGLEDLPMDMQEKILRALDQGHVDDEEWKGVSMPYEQPTNSVND